MSITIEQIEKEWAKDSKIDLTDLSQTSASQFELHHKYHKILNHSKKQLRTYENARKKLIHLKTDYYEGQLPPVQLKELNWEPNRRRVFKTDLDRFLEADDDIIEVNTKIGELNDIIAFCDSIIRAIGQKPFIIKNITESRKFDNGGY